MSYFAMLCIAFVFGVIGLIVLLSGLESKTDTTKIIGGVLLAAGLIGCLYSAWEMNKLIPADPLKSSA